MSENLRILDLTAGNRAIWFDKQHPAAVFVDRRTEVEPDFVADSSALPAEIGTGYGLVVFDPPHKNNGQGENFGMTRSYGHSTAEEIRDLIAGAAKEAHRVAADDALMAFKWNDHTRKLSSVLALLHPYWEPLFGHGISHQQRSTGTYWVMLRRCDCFNPSPVRIQDRGAD